MIPVCLSVCICTLRSGESPTDMDLLYSKDYQMFFNNLEEEKKIFLLRLEGSTYHPSHFTQVTQEK